MPHRIKVSYHHFSNDNVTPAFVSRYMLRKLDQNYL